MTVSNGKSAMDVLTDFAKYTNDCHARGVEPALDEALAALEEIMVAAKPEALVDILQDGKYYPFGAGYNSGIKDYEHNIRQAFSNSN